MSTWGGGTLESNPGRKRKKILLIVIGILLSLGIIISVSYAWWSHIVSQEGINTIESTCLEIELTDENPIHLQNAYPITDAEAKILIPYTFTITNTCNTAVEYDVNLDIMESTSRLSSEYIAVEFNGETKKLLNTLESVEPSYPGSDYIPVEARYLTSGELGANESKTYTIKLWMDESVTVEDDAMNKNFISKIVVTAKQSHIVRLVDYVMSETSKDFEKFEHPETYQTPALTDYRYTGSNPNNYVCFGSEESVCPEDNLYRIIGVIPTQSEIGGEYENRVKLIKNDYYTENESGLLSNTNLSYPAPGATGKGYRWNEINSNNWEEASLNTEVLNKVYWKNLEDYQNYIVPSIWYLGAPYWETSTYKKEITPNYLYFAEHSNIESKSGGSLSFVANISLMYISDYAYSIGEEYKKQSVYENKENYIYNSWLYSLESKYYEWTMTPESSYYTPSAWYVYPTGEVRIEYASDANKRFYWGIRPTFYLKSNVLYKSGTGTKENPYRIGINE